MAKLSGRTAVVTGASAGLGRALAVALAREGADVVLLARRRPALEETAARVRAEGRRALVCPVDIQSPEGVEHVRAAIAAEVRPQILINNAGQFLAGPLADQEAAAVAGILGTVVTGTALITRALLPVLREGRPGHIINIGARVAAPGYPARARDTSVVYQTAKGALALFSQLLRQEVSPEVRVSTLYLPAIGSRADLDDPDSALAALYGSTPVLPLRVVTGAVLRLLAGDGPVAEELVLAP